VKAGRLADEHQVGVWITGAEDDLRSPSREGTLGATGDNVAEGTQLVGAAELSDRSHSFRRNSRRYRS
jgi:hypothetical protein